MNAVRPSVARVARVGAPATQEIITVQDFDALLAGAGERPLLVLFKADWCRVCTVLRGQIEGLLRTSHRPCTVVLVEVDRLPSLARRFAVRHLPTLVILEQGLTVLRCVGHRPPEVMRDMLAPTLFGGFSPDADLPVSPQA